jgi:8-oxo-dGTP pyrophosphatase MutT (NUDIX family)
VCSSKGLVWEEEGRKEIFDFRVFSVHESYCKSPNDELKTFTIIDAADWAIIVPVLETEQGRQFIMVRQWRHGSQCMSLEFPGGVFEPGEDPQAAAARELLEETGYKSGSITKMGEFSPNPAIMSNKVHFFLAENLVDTGRQTLDADEFIEVATVSVEAVIKGMGKLPYVHALMGSALSFYLQQLNY